MSGRPLDRLPHANEHRELGVSLMQFGFCDSSVLSAARNVLKVCIEVPMAARSAQGSQAAGASCRFWTRLPEHVHLYAASVEQAI